MRHLIFLKTIGADDCNKKNMGPTMPEFCFLRKK
jgi:hypothetical protein